MSQNDHAQRLAVVIRTTGTDDIDRLAAARLAVMITDSHRLMEGTSPRETTR